MKKSFFRPGMMVQHNVSGTIGEVRGNEHGELVRRIKKCLAVRYRTIGGKYRYATWDVNNLSLSE